jgi:C1A family cysteine protease
MITPSVLNLKDRVSKQPVVANMIMSDFVFNYKGGFVSEIECPTDGETHSVVIVGYSGTPDEKNICPKGYWIVMNSFGTGWADAGYMYLCIVDDDTKKD